MARANVVNGFWVAGISALAIASSAMAAPTKAAPRATHVKPRSAKVAPPAPTAPVAVALATPVSSVPVGLVAPAPAAPPATESALVVEYQRIFRDLTKLEQLRGPDCTRELWAKFRSLKLAEMCKTAEGRLDLDSTFKDLRVRMERKRGIELSAECLNNPLAVNCQ